MKRILTNTVHAEIASARGNDWDVKISLRKKIDKRYLTEEREKQKRAARKLENGQSKDEEDETDDDESGNTYETELLCTYNKQSYVYELYDEKQHGAQVFVNRLIENASSALPVLLQTIRLVKKWLSQHLLLELHYSHEAVELICLSVLQKIDCTDVWTGFNNVLKFFSTYSFATQPVLVQNQQVEELNKHVKSNEIPLNTEAVKIAFEKRRKLDPTLCHCPIYIATSRDIESRDWTWDSPTKPILKRTKDLATATLDFLRSNYLTLTKAQYNQLFTPSWAQFDAIIYIKQKGIKHTQRYVMELQLVYGHTALFFYDAQCSNRIGVMLHPSLWEPRVFKKSIQFPVKHLEVNTNVLIYDEMTQDILRIILSVPIKRKF